MSMAVSSIPGFPYSTGELSETNSALDVTNSATVKFEACNGDRVTLSNCESFNGDTIIRLYDDVFNEVAVADDSCGTGSALVYSVTSSGCQNYTLVMGCFSILSCSMTMSGTITVVTSNDSVLIEASSDFDMIYSLAKSNLYFRNMQQIININGSSNLSFINCTTIQAQTGKQAVFDIKNVLQGRIVVESCSFLNTSASAGLILLSSTSAPTLVSDNFFSNCMSGSNGGALRFESQVQNVLVTNSTFIHCFAAISGGCIYMGSNNANISMDAISMHASSWWWNIYRE